MTEPVPFALILLLLASLAYPISWQDYIALPIDQKMILQNQRLNKIAEGSIPTPYISPQQAASILGIKILIPITTAPTITVINQPTNFIKVGDRYVSESICKAYPKECEAPIIVQNKTKVAQAPANKRTAAECVAAREKDWDAFVWSNYPNIDPNANGAEKEALLDRMAEGYYSWQAKCLRGE